MFDAEVEEEIRKIAVKNAVEYGKAMASTVISRSLSKFPELRQEIKGLSEYATELVGEINAMDSGQLKNEARKYSEEFKTADIEKAEKGAVRKMELDGATSGNFVTRFGPEPNGYMQIGHAKVTFTGMEFAGIYKGKLALYFDDTNPDKEKQEYVDAFRRDLRWLGIKYDTEYFASDNVDKLYMYAETLINDGRAYVCSCSAEEIKDKRGRGIGCGHKRQGVKKNMEMWKEMFTAEESSGMILRLNSNLKDENTTMRDPTLFRIKTAAHYRQGREYRVWPTYLFNTPIIDSIKGITDVIRSKEFELVDQLYFYILDSLKLRKPRIHSIARLEIKDNITSKRQINAMMAEGRLWGYDDPRLVTIAGLRRRGISPIAIRSFVMRFGMSKSESRVSIEMLLAENRKVVDREAARLFFVEKPVGLVVHGIPEEARNVKIRMHPSAELGYRRYRLSNKFFINTYDANNLSEGAKIRLKDAFSIKVKAFEGNDIIAEYVGEGNGGETARIHWVNEGNYIACKVYIIGNLLVGEEFNKDSITLKEGYVESHAESLLEGNIVQFERVGFFKLDSKNELAFISL